MKKARQRRIPGGPFLRVRNYFTERYLTRTLAVTPDSLGFHFQPPLLVLARVALVAIVVFNLYALYPIVGSWIQKGFEFFQLHEIYNFEFPKNSFFHSIAQYLFLLVIGYYGLFFMIRQIQALFSTLAVSRAERKIYYLKNTLIVKHVYLFQISEIDHIILKQNIIGRLFGVGTIVLSKKNGESVVVAALRNAPGIVREFSRIRSDRGEENESSTKKY